MILEIHPHQDRLYYLYEQAQANDAYRHLERALHTKETHTAWA